MTADAPILYDWSGAPVASSYAPITGRPGQALNSTAQGGMVILGSDSNGAARVPRVDASGSQYMVGANPAGGNALVSTGQAAGAAAGQFGSLTMARQDSPAPSSFYPLNMDMQMSLNVHLKSKATFRAIATGVTCSAGKQIFTLSYASTGTMVLRLQEMGIYVPPGGYSGGLLGASQATYYPLLCEMRRITASAVTGGSSITPQGADTADTLTAGVSCVAGATVSASQSAFHRQDAVQTTQAGIVWYGRADVNEKTLVIRPGEGLTITCMSSGQITGPTGGMATAAVDILAVFTQAVA